jgi:hypothetical protein
MYLPKIDVWPADGAKFFRRWEYPEIHRVYLLLTLLACYFVWITVATRLCCEIQYPFSIGVSLPLVCAVILVDGIFDDRYKNFILSDHARPAEAQAPGPH